MLRKMNSKSMIICLRPASTGLETKRGDIRNVVIHFNFVNRHNLRGKRSRQQIPALRAARQQLRAESWNPSLAGERILRVLLRNSRPGDVERDEFDDEFDDECAELDEFYRNFNIGGVLPQFPFGPVQRGGLWVLGPELRLSVAEQPRNAEFPEWLSNDDELF